MERHSSPDGKKALLSTYGASPCGAMAIQPDPGINIGHPWNVASAGCSDFVPQSQSAPAKTGDALGYN